MWPPLPRINISWPTKLQCWSPRPPNLRTHAMSFKREEHVTKFSDSSVISQNGNGNRKIPGLGISIFEYRYTEILKLFSVIFWIPKYWNSNQPISVLYRNTEIQAKPISVLYRNTEIQAKPISVLYRNTEIQGKPISVFPKLATLYAITC